MSQQSDFNAAPKPKGFTHYHYAVMRCLMDEKPPIRLSQETIAARTGISRRQVIRVLAKLHEWKWLHAYSGKRQFNTNSVEIMYANLPQPEQLVPLVITTNAINLADYFKHFWLERCHKYKNKKGHNCTRPLRKDWKQRWESVFQQRLNEGYGYIEMGELIKNADAKLLLAGPQSRKLFPIRAEKTT